MKKIFCITILSVLYIISCEAQFFIGPSIGINQYFMHFSPQNNNYYNFSKTSANYGLKTEIWFSKYLFLSTMHRISSNNHELKIDVRDPDAPYYVAHKFKHFQNNLLINGYFNNNIAVGIGLNQTRNYALSTRTKGGGWSPDDTTTIDKNFKFNQWGGILSISKSVNSVLFEVSYAFSKGNNLEWLQRYTHAIQLNMSYLFKTNLKFSKKGLDCPRF